LFRIIWCCQKRFEFAASDRLLQASGRYNKNGYIKRDHALIKPT